MNNIDFKTVESFGEEWLLFDQLGMSELESEVAFKQYFSIFPWDILPVSAEGFDMGCGSGRWAKFVAPKVFRLNCIDPSIAIHVAKKCLVNFENIVFHKTSVDNSGLAEESQDFGYSIGVLHHIPNTYEGLNSCVKLLKKGAPLLLYIYYSFENRPFWYKLLWKSTDLMRKVIYRLPNKIKNFVTDTIAILVYFPVARLSKILEKLGINVREIPLSYYRNRSFYTLRTDSRDRFGTPLEKRFTRSQIEKMMIKAGLIDIRFSEKEPYWCAVGIKA
jgi:SAM-dependent methyltransferase